MASDEVIPFKRLQDRVTAVLKKHGLLSINTTFVVDPHTGMQVLAVNDPDFKEPDPVLDELDAIQKATEEAERKAAQDAQAEKTRRDLTSLKDQLRKPENGIL